MLVTAIFSVFFRGEYKMKMKGNCKPTMLCKRTKFYLETEGKANDR